MTWREIDEAIAGVPSNYLSAHYQPIVKIEEVGSNHPTILWEALVRWHINGVELPAGSFMPGMLPYPETLVNLDWWMLRTVAEELKKGDRHRIAVNLSACTLDDKFFPKAIGDLFYGLHPSDRLVLELTERSTLTSTARSVLKQIGTHCCYVIDDFGEGHSSIALESDLAPCGLKLGEGLMKGVLSAPKKQAWVRLLIQYAVAHGIYLVAEFVEDEAIVQWLRGLKKETPALELWAQGWGVGR